IDHSTVQEVISDLRKRFEFGRLVFVGDRGMVTDENIESITKDKHGFLVGVKRRRNAQLDVWLDAVDDAKWIDSPGGINPRERKPSPPRPRAQEVPWGDSDLRVIVIDSDERRGYEQAKREQAMERARQRLEKLQERVAAGDLKRPEKIGAAVERIMQKYHGYRYFDWKLNGGALEFSESETRLGREKTRVANLTRPSDVESEVKNRPRRLLMRKPRRPRPQPDHVLNLAPVTRHCPECRSRTSADYHNFRSVTTLDGTIRMTLLIRRCPNPDCSRFR